MSGNEEYEHSRLSYNGCHEKGHIKRTCQNYYKTVALIPCSDKKSKYLVLWIRSQGLEGPGLMEKLNRRFSVGAVP